MQPQDPKQLPHRGGTAVNAVPGADNHFARGPVKMAAGVRHHTVAAAGMIGLFPVADDRMIDDSFLDAGAAESLDVNIK